MKENQKVNMKMTEEENIKKENNKRNESEDYPFYYSIRIPKERVGVLIGKNGKEKKELEELTKSKIKVDSKEGYVEIFGKDSILLFTLKEIIRAIGRGFNPEIAMLLLKQDY